MKFDFWTASAGLAFVIGMMALAWLLFPPFTGWTLWRLDRWRERRRRRRWPRP